jgi:hypothetical protein
MSYEFGAHSVVIHTTDTVTAVKLGGIFSMGMPLNTEISQDDNGQIYDSFASINMQAPTPQWGTRSVALALAAIPQTGICINVDGSHPGVKFYGEAKGDCTTGEPASNEHLSYLMDGGLMVPMQLSGSRREAVKLTCEIDAISKSLNAPFASSYAATLPTGLNIDEYILGAMKIGNVIWYDARSMSLDFQVQRTEKEPQLGGVWPDRASRRKARPKLTVTARDPRKLDDSVGIPLLGKTGTHANTVLYFRKKLNGGALEDPAATVHFKMTMNGMCYFDNPFSANGDAPAETTVMVNALKDATNAPLIFTFGIAYNPAP